MKIIILSILCGILLLISFILLIQNYKLKKDTRALIESIDEFTNQGKTTQISLWDNDFARLQNAVGDLEELVNLEKGKLYNENKKNVQFISDISHQLKTPIAALRLYCEMDLASGENTHAQKELELIDKTEQLIYKLLKLEKVKLDTYYMNFEQNDLNEICQKLILDFKPLFKEKNFELNGTSKIRCVKTSATASEGGSFPVTILQPCGRQNKPSVRTGAVWGGHWFESVLPYCILRQE